VARVDPERQRDDEKVVELLRERERVRSHQLAHPRPVSQIGAIEPLARDPVRAQSDRGRVLDLPPVGADRHAVAAEIARYAQPLAVIGLRMKADALRLLDD
jgi:hypothetical protein